MKKTKLGISVGLLGAVAYLLTGFSGYIPALLIAGYVLLFEEDEWLKKVCVKALALAVCFTVLFQVIGLLPAFLSLVNNFISLIDGLFRTSLLSDVFSPITRTLNNIINLFTGVLNIIETGLFLILGIKALNQKDISFPVVDKLVDKFF